MTGPPLQPCPSVFNRMCGSGAVLTDINSKTQFQMKDVKDDDYNTDVKDVKDDSVSSPDSPRGLQKREKAVVFDNEGIENNTAADDLFPAVTRENHVSAPQDAQGTEGGLTERRDETLHRIKRKTTRAKSANVLDTRDTARPEDNGTKTQRKRGSRRNTIDTVCNSRAGGAGPGNANASKGKIPRTKSKAWWEVDTGCLRIPCASLQVSAGTSRFFVVNFRENVLADDWPLGWIGKDVSKDVSKAEQFEVEFYLKLMKARTMADPWCNFVRTTLSCAGVANVPCVLADGEKEMRKLIVIENLKNGFSACRILDIKLGAKTCVAGWKGRTRVDAMKKFPIDYYSNSSAESFRLEGMSVQPLALKEYVAAEVVQGRKRSWMGANGLVNKDQLARYALQRLRGVHVLDAFFDFSALGPGVEARVHVSIWNMLTVVDNILKAVLKIPVPQQWIGSSLGICVETAPDSEPKVAAKLFDWGRSELIWKNDYARLPPATKRERFNHWTEYIRGLSRFQWEVCRLSLHRCCCPSWSAVVLVFCNNHVSLMSKHKSDATQMVLFELPEGGKASGTLVENMQRASRPSQRMAAADAVAGTCHMKYELSDFGADGERSVVVGPIHASAISKNDLTIAKLGAVVVQYFLFEHKKDAQRHVKSWVDGETVPPRTTHFACVRRTGPARVNEKEESLYWNESFQVLGLGAKPAEEAQRRLEEFLPASSPDIALKCKSDENPINSSSSTESKSFSKSESQVDSKEKRSGCLRWLPSPARGNNVDAEATAFSIYVAPWLASKEPPAHWT